MDEEIPENISTERKKNIKRNPKRNESKKSSKRLKKEVQTQNVPEYTARFNFQEKVDLYNGLVEHGSSHINLLQKFVPGRTEEEIRNFVFGHKRLARHGIVKGRERMPIDVNFDYLASKMEDYKEKRHDIYMAMKYIALFEPRLDTGKNLNYSDCYKVIADCIKGESPKHLDPYTSFFFYYELRKFSRILRYRYIEDELKFLKPMNKKKPVMCYSGKKKGVEEKVVISRTTISNPLKIPDSLLQLKK